MLATILVDTFVDVVDPGDGFTSLREAIIQANANGENDEIVLQAGTYELQIVGAMEDGAAAGDLDVKNDQGHSLSIVGAGMAQTTIDANQLDARQRYLKFLDDFPNLYLYQIDDLQAACQRNRHEREKEWPKAQRIITEETQHLLKDLNHRATGPVIKRLREHAQQIKDDELSRLLPKLQALGGEPAMQKEIEKSLDRLINKLLHPPLSSLKEDAAGGHEKGLVKALRELFRLGD